MVRGEGRGLVSLYKASPRSLKSGGSEGGKGYKGNKGGKGKSAGEN